MEQDETRYGNVPDMPEDPDDTNELLTEEKEESLPPDNIRESPSEEKPKKRISLFAALILALVLCIGVFLSTFTLMKNRMNAQYDQMAAEFSRFSKFGALLDYVESEYVRGCEESELMDAAYAALFSATGDPYSCYMTAEEFAEYQSDRGDSYVGIGINVVYDAEAGGIHIYRVTPDSPAEKAGLQKDDIIKRVGDTEVTIRTYQDAIKAVQGEAGTEVTLTVERNGVPLEITAVRGVCPTIEVLYEKLEGGIAYIRILSFRTDAAVKQFADSLAQAKEDGCASYLFDVRNNPGGDLGVICDVLDQLIKDAVLLHMVDADGTDTVRETKTDAYLDAPMAVLCNGDTASAAELFTADLRENKQAYIVGTKTYGKGTMQSIRALTDGSAVKLTNRYYNPTSNVSYDGIGIVPDEEVSLTSDQQSRFYLLTHEEDPQLQAAIARLRK